MIRGVGWVSLRFQAPKGCQMAIMIPAVRPTLALVRTRSTNLIPRPLDAILDLSAKRPSLLSVFCVFCTRFQGGCVCMEVLENDSRCMNDDEW